MASDVRARAPLAGGHWFGGVARACLGAALAAACAGAAAQGPPSLALRSLAATCAQCHGTDGRVAPGSLVAPLAGMPAARFLERMAAFRAGTDGTATLMPQLAKGFSQDQLARLAAYFSSLPP